MRDRELRETIYDKKRKHTESMERVKANRLQREQEMIKKYA
jgi:hypothetical protein